MIRERKPASNAALVAMRMIGGDGGFCLVCEDFGRMFDNLFPTCTFFWGVEIGSLTLIPLFRPRSVHSGSAG